jgi:DNA-binding MarR family transcriptional regulator
MTKKQQEMTALIREIRTAFNRLKAIAEALHADLEVNPSMRAVLQALVSKAPQTVPEIAKERGVSRQHVQKVMNALLERGLVRTEDNPDHKRSDFYSATPKGQGVFAEIQTRELEPMEKLSDALPEREVIAATQLLAQLNETIETITITGE